MRKTDIDKLHYSSDLRNVMETEAWWDKVLRRLTAGAAFVVVLVVWLTVDSWS